MSESKEKYIPINKGHFELDTPERNAEFQRKMGYGWEDDYHEYRRLWVDLPKKSELRDYPLLVDLEMSSICNLHCPMCPTISKEFKEHVETGFLDYELVRKVIDEIAGKVYALRLSLVGEPTLHKNFVEAIRYAKERGIPEVSFLTNGSRLDIEFFKKIAEAGADWITISIDGIDEEYEKIRRPLKFKDMLTKLQAIKAYKESKGFMKPVIKIQSVWPAIRSNPNKFYDIVAPLADLVAYNPLIDYLHNDFDIVYETNFSCPQLYQRLVVCSTGKAKVCSNDEWRTEIVGDVATQTIYDIWHGDKFNQIRKVHKEDNGFLSMSACRMCYYPRKAIPNEKAKVGKRLILIENYVNRKQTVGE